MTQSSAAHRARLRWIFIGSRGLRAGWSVLIFLALLAPLRPIDSVLQRYYPALFAGDMAPGDSLLIELLQLLFVVVATVVTGRIEGRPVWSYYGLAGERR